MLKVTCAIILKGDKILLTQRGQHPHHPFQWEFPGGKLKAGESPEQCIRREILEELNVTVAIAEKAEPVIYDYGFKTIELIPFVCRIQSGNFTLNEHINAKWVYFNETIANTLSEADRKLIQNKKNQTKIRFHIQKNRKPGNSTI